MKGFFDKIEQIFSKKAVLIALSVVCAIVAWLLVMDSVNPNVEKTYSVNISYENFYEPAEQQLTLVEDLNIVTAEIKVSGREKLLDKVTAEDFEISVDFAGIQESGVSYISVSKPTCAKLGVKILDYTPRTLTVNYDKKVELYLPVKSNYTEALAAAGYEIIDVSVEPENVPMSGFESELENLEYVAVNISDQVEDGSVDSDKTITLIGRFMASTGADVTANYETEKFTVKINVAKRVPVTYTVGGTLAEDCYVEKVVASCENVLVDGNSQELTAIEEINIGEISLDGQSESFEVNLSVNELAGGSIYAVNSDDENIKVEVIVGKKITKTIEIPTESIARSGIDDNFEYACSLDNTKSIKVTLKGKESDLDSISISSLKVTLKMPTQTGTYPNQSLEFELPDGVTLVGEYTAYVKVTEKVVETPVPEETIAPTEAEPATETAATN